MKKLTTILFFGLMASATIISCKKEGPMGKNGKDGTDGNANVNIYLFDSIASSVISFIGQTYSSWGVEVSISKEDHEKDAFLQYAKYGTSYNLMPGSVIRNFGGSSYILDASSFYSSTDSTVHFQAGAWDFAGNGFVVPTTDSIMKQYKIVHIKSTNTTSVMITSSASISPTQAVINELKNAGINPNNYDAVCRYYAVEPK